MPADKVSSGRPPSLHFAGEDLPSAGYEKVHEFKHSRIRRVSGIVKVNRNSLAQERNYERKLSTFGHAVENNFLLALVFSIRLNHLLEAVVLHLFVSQGTLLII